MNAVKREPVPTRVLNLNASKSNYNPKQRSYRTLSTEMLLYRNVAKRCVQCSVAVLAISRNTIREGGASHKLRKMADPAFGSVRLRLSRCALLEAHEDVPPIGCTALLEAHEDVPPTGCTEITANERIRTPDRPSL